MWLQTFNNTKNIVDDVLIRATLSRLPKGCRIVIPKPAVKKATFCSAPAVVFHEVPLLDQPVSDNPSWYFFEESYN
jgi:hypothetical protein